MTERTAGQGLALGLGAMVVALMAGGPPATADSNQAKVRAMIVRPLSLANGSDMSFGTVMANESAGTVTLMPSGKFTLRGASVADKTEVKSASFKIRGENSQAYTIMLPAAATLSGGSKSVRVMTFRHDAGGTPILDQKGYGHFNVGATLTVSQNLAAGVYRGRVDVIISNN